MKQTEMEKDKVDVAFGNFLGKLPMEKAVGQVVLLSGWKVVVI